MNYLKRAFGYFISVKKTFRCIDEYKLYKRSNFVHLIFNSWCETQTCCRWFFDRFLSYISKCRFKNNFAKLYELLTTHFIGRSEILVRKSFLIGVIQGRGTVNKLKSIIRPRLKVALTLNNMQISAHMRICTNLLMSRVEYKFGYVFPVVQSVCWCTDNPQQISFIIFITRFSTYNCIHIRNFWFYIMLITLFQYFKRKNSTCNSR